MRIKCQEKLSQHSERRISVGKWKERAEGPRGAGFCISLEMPRRASRVWRLRWEGGVRQPLEQVITRRSWGRDTRVTGSDRARFVAAAVTRYLPVMSHCCCYYIKSQLAAREAAGPSFGLLRKLSKLFGSSPGSRPAPSTAHCSAAAQVLGCCPGLLLWPTTDES